MGLLDQIAGGARGGGAPQKAGLGQTVAAGVILALLVKAIRAHQAQPQGRSFDPAPAPAQAQGAGQGGLGGILGSLTGGGGLGGLLGGSLGGLLGGLGGAGALGGLVRQMQQNGFGQQVNSWVGPGHNEPIAPQQVPQALGEDTVRELQQQTGLPRESLLQEIANVLPQAVNEATPAGRPPSDEELHQMAHGATPQA